VPDRERHRTDAREQHGDARRAARREDDDRQRRDRRALQRVMRRGTETVQIEGDGDELDQLRRRFMTELQEAQRSDQREQRAVGDRSRIVDRFGLAAEGERERLRRVGSRQVIGRIPGERQRDGEQQRERDPRRQRRIDHGAQQANE
jgi:hypothetical protein